MIELGAWWVPGMLAKLDGALRNFCRSEPQLTAMPLTPREHGLSADRLSIPEAQARSSSM